MEGRRYKVIELGPFGCQIDRGTIEDLEDIPKGYKVEKIEKGKDIIIVFIEPASKKIS